MSENVLFQSTITYDKPTHLEFQRAVIKSAPSHLVLKIILSVLLFLMIIVRLFDGMNESGIMLSVYTLLIWVICFCNIRWGGNYKRLLSANMGQPQQFNYCFLQDSIEERNADGAVIAKFSYDQVRRVIESKNYYILMLKHRIGVLVRKDAMPKDIAERFLDFLGWHCPKWKATHPSRGNAGQIMDWVTGILTVATLILCLVKIPVIQLPDVQPSGSQQGSLTNDMTYREMAQKLQLVDIHISEQAIKELEEYDTEYAAEHGKDYYSGFFAGSKVYDLLYWEACGFYDENTWEWTPSQSGVYYFDTEVMNVDSIYTEFFTGLSNMNADLNFTNIREDYSGADLEAGTGTVAVSFDWKGRTYNLDAVYDYDWFDAEFLCEVGQIIAADSDSRDLYVYYDEVGCLLYYGTTEQVQLLEALTGLHFENTVLPL